MKCLLEANLVQWAAGRGCVGRGHADCTSQFADVARPVVAEKAVQHAGAEWARAPLRPQLLIHEVAGQEGNVRLTLSQRRNAQRERPNAIVEIEAEPTFGALDVQILVGGEDDPGVHLDRVVPPHRTNLAELDHAQERGLGMGGQVADFVEEDGPRASLDQQPAPAPIGACERPAFVPK